MKNVAKRYVDWCNEQRKDRRLVRRNNVIVVLVNVIVFGVIIFIERERKNNEITQIFDIKRGCLGGQLWSCGVRFILRHPLLNKN